jgi:hypothetical protein
VWTQIRLTADTLFRGAKCCRQANFGVSELLVYLHTCSTWHSLFLPHYSVFTDKYQYIQLVCVASMMAWCGLGLVCPNGAGFTASIFLSLQCAVRRWVLLVGDTCSVECANVCVCGFSLHFLSLYWEGCYRTTVTGCYCSEPTSPSSQATRMKHWLPKSAFFWKLIFSFCSVTDSWCTSHWGVFLFLTLWKVYISVILMRQNYSLSEWRVIYCTSCSLCCAIITTSESPLS